MNGQSPKDEQAQAAALLRWSRDPAGIDSRLSGMEKRRETITVEHVVRFLSFAPRLSLRDRDRIIRIVEALADEPAGNAVPPPPVFQTFHPAPPAQTPAVVLEASA